MMENIELVARAANLPYWTGRVEPEPILGGITNTNFVVRDGGQKYFVRIGDDIPVHGVIRSNEVAAARAAADAEVSPELLYYEPGAIVTRFVEGRTLKPEDLRSSTMLKRIVPLLRSCHRAIPTHLRGPILMFWVFHVIRDYVQSLRDAQSRHLPRLSELLDKANTLEADVGPVEIVFAHNDLLAANFIDDGERLWLIDWDYAGFGSPLFDLGNLASNNELSSEAAKGLLERYYGKPADDSLWQQFQAMKCASLLRETMWSMVSEYQSTLEFDYVSYTNEYLDRFYREFDAYRKSG